MRHPKVVSWTSYGPGTARPPRLPKTGRLSPCPITHRDPIRTNHVLAFATCSRNISRHAGVILRPTMSLVIRRPLRNRCAPTNPILANISRIRRRSRVSRSEPSRAGVNLSTKHRALSENDLFTSLLRPPVLRVGVGIVMAHDPLHGSGRAAFPHPALALGDDAHTA